VRLRLILLGWYVRFMAEKPSENNAMGGVEEGARLLADPRGVNPDEPVDNHG
jgi:hypothetical protein